MQIWVGDGNISSDIKIVGQSGKVATTSIAVERGMKGMDGKWVTDFLNLRFLGEKMVGRAQKELSKGTPVSVQGKVCHDSYTDRDGVKKYYDYIMVNQFKTHRKAAENSTEGAIDSENAVEGGVVQEQKQEFMNIPDSADADGLPFG